MLMARLTSRIFGPVGLFLVSLIVVALVVMALGAAGDLANKSVGLADVKVTYISHAASKHGANNIQRIRDCLDKNGPIQTWHNPKTDRWAEICQLEDDLFGLRITANIDGLFEELTGWIEEPGTCISKIEEYLIRQGYMPIK